MKLNKTALAVISSALIACVPALADTVTLGTTTHDEISNGLNSFATTLLTVIPESATQQNVWADAYIGKLFPALPPHFGGGITIGGTQLDMTGFKTAANALISGYNSSTSLLNTLGLTSIDALSFGSIPDSFFMPTATVDIRIGGFVLPFDIGICAMMTNPSLTSIDLSNPDSVTSASQAVNYSWLGFNGYFDYLTIGADVRYALLEGNLVLPKVSLGAGYYLTKGEFGVSTSSDANSLTTSANMDMAFDTQTAFVQAEVSKSIAIATIFGGVRGVVSSSTDSWAWNYSTTYDNSIVSVSASDSDSGTVSSGNGISSTYQNGSWDFSAVQPQLYAGVGFNFLVLQTTVSACWDMRDNLWSGAFSFRAKI